MSRKNKIVGIDSHRAKKSNCHRSSASNRIRQKRKKVQKAAIESNVISQIEEMPIAVGQTVIKSATNEKSTPGNSVKYTPSNEEYNMLRAEILQYMEEYQNLRNMMYVGTATLLGFNSALWINLYLFLLPLVIILPSYIIYYDYWKSVSVASLYIQKFLEKDGDDKFVGNRRWETMHQEFSIELKRRKDGSIRWLRHFAPRWSGMQCHKIPYVVCTVLCLSVYGYFLYAGEFHNEAINMHIAIPLGALALVCSILAFTLYRQPSYKIISNAWEQTKNRIEGNPGFPPRKEENLTCIRYVKYLFGQVRRFCKKKEQKK